MHSAIIMFLTKIIELFIHLILPDSTQMISWHPGIWHWHCLKIQLNLVNNNFVCKLKSFKSSLFFFNCTESISSILVLSVELLWYTLCYYYIYLEGGNRCPFEIWFKVIKYLLTCRLPWSHQQSMIRITFVCMKMFSDIHSKIHVHVWPLNVLER